MIKCNDEAKNYINGIESNHAHIIHTLSPKAEYSLINSKFSSHIIFKLSLFSSPKFFLINLRFSPGESVLITKHLFNTSADMAPVSRFIAVRNSIDFGRGSVITTR